MRYEVWVSFSARVREAVQTSTCHLLWVCLVVQQECWWQAILESKSLRQSADLVVAPWTRLRTFTRWFSSSCSLAQSSSSASVLISLATAPGRDRARMLWLTAAISTAREMGSWWSAWLPASSLKRQVCELATVAVKRSISGYKNTKCILCFLFFL